MKVMSYKPFVGERQTVYVCDCHGKVLPTLEVARTHEQAHRDRRLLQIYPRWDDAGSRH